MKTPDGLAEIVATFGNINEYIQSDGQLSPLWESSQMRTARLAFPLSLSWAPSIIVSRITCHRLLVPAFEGVFSLLLQEELSTKIRSFGGCFNYRAQRASHKLSTHSWGISIDLNPDANKQGTDGNMDATVVKIFEDVGFFWGGRFSGDRKDPMHFQFATSY